MSLVADIANVLVIVIVGSLGHKLTVSGLHLAGLPKTNKTKTKRFRWLTKFCSCRNRYPVSGAQVVGVTEYT